LTQSNFALFGLFGKLANLVGDHGCIELGDEGLLKMLTGIDAVKFERKREDAFNEVNRARLVSVQHHSNVHRQKRGGLGPAGGHRVHRHRAAGA
jgi:hypothetical protein